MTAALVWPLCIVIVLCLLRRINPLALGVGVLGWFAASYLLRKPVGNLFTSRLSDVQMQAATWLVLSGLTEEPVRLISVLILGRSLAAAASVGAGWAAVEIAVQVALFAVGTQQLDQLPGGPRSYVRSRLTVTVYHLVASLLVAVSPWFVIGLILYHSGSNLWSAYRQYQRQAVKLSQSEVIEI